MELLESEIILLSKFERVLNKEIVYKDDHVYIEIIYVKNIYFNLEEFLNFFNIKFEDKLQYWTKDFTIYKLTCNYEQCLITNNFDNYVERWNL